MSEWHDDDHVRLTERGRRAVESPHHCRAVAILHPRIGGRVMSWQVRCDQCGLLRDAYAERWDAEQAVRRHYRP